MAKKKALKTTMKVLSIIGGGLWALVGVGQVAKVNLNVVDIALGGYPVVEGIVYAVAGIATVWYAFMK